MYFPIAPSDFAYASPDAFSAIIFPGLFVSCPTLFPVRGTATTDSGPGVLLTEVVTALGTVVDAPLLGVQESSSIHRARNLSACGELYDWIESAAFIYSNPCSAGVLVAAGVAFSTSRSNAC